MRKYATLAVAAIAAFGLVSCTSGADPAIENTAEVKPADRVPEKADNGQVAWFKGAGIARHTVETSDGRLVDCFTNKDDYSGGISCIPLKPETEPATEPTPE